MNDIENAELTNSEETTKTDKILKVLGILVLVGAIVGMSYVAYDAQVRVDEYDVKITNLTDSIAGLSAKQLADQESNLKDLEENKIVEDKVKALEVIVAEQQTKIAELESKLTKKKK